MAGLGVPRPPIRLAGNPGAPRAVRVADTSADVTDALLAVARGAAPDMGALRGYIFKRGSPSCGMERVKVYATPGKSPRMGRGLFARAVMQAHPLLPCEEEGRLNDASLRESFVERVFAYDRWLRAMAQGCTPGRLVAFHTRHKFLLLSHSEVHYRAAGRLVADAGRYDRERLAHEYLSTFMEGMRRQATRRRHTNVRSASADSSSTPSMPVIGARFPKSSRIPHWGRIPCRADQVFAPPFRRVPDRYVEMQHYLEPHPDELGLRNHL